MNSELSKKLWHALHRINLVMDAMDKTDREMPVEVINRISEYLDTANESLDAAADLVKPI